MKNPLNATVIHLELLKQQLSSTDLPLAMEHLSIITAQIRRLDEVVQGFLQFIRPEDLKLQPVSVSAAGRRHHARRDGGGAEARSGRRGRHPARTCRS